MLIICKIKKYVNILLILYFFVLNSWLMYFSILFYICIIEGRGWLCMGGVKVSMIIF